MKEHTFEMDLSAGGRTSRILLDGQDISDLLQGVLVETDVYGGTSVTLRCAKRQSVGLRATLPESRVVIVSDDRWAPRKLWRWLVEKTAG
jgi:hypothetical protein